MNVTGLDVTVKRSEPDPNPVRDALQTLPGVGSVEVEVRTAEGISGVGEVEFGRTAGALDALSAVITDELEPVVRGTDPAFVRASHEAMLAETEYHGSFGLSMFGIAAVDTALWDCLGTARGVPCWQLWGAAHERIPAYATVGWLNYGEEELGEVCADAVEQGFRAVKLKVGSATLEADVRRVEVARETVGDDISLMVDANQSLTTAEAIRRGRAFEELGCAWWEEPIPADDVDGYAALAAALDIPIATGENLYTPAEFGRFLRRDAVDIVQPDLRRAGGPTGLLQVGAVANAFRRPYASHGGGAVQVSVMACLPNAHYLETGVLDTGSALELDEGHIKLPQGSGFSWS